MANHVRQQLREAVATACTGLVTTGTRVFQNRVRPLAAADLPGLVITTPGDAATVASVHNPPLLERVTQVVVAGYAAATADVDDTLDQIAKEVETALAAGVVLGSKTVDLVYTGGEIDFDGEADKPRGRIELRFTATLFTAANAPDVLQ